MVKQYNNTDELLDGLGLGKQVTEKIRAKISRGSIAKSLAAMRCSKGLTQNELADRMGCTQSAISKVEHSSDDDIKVKTVADYANTLDIPITIRVAEPKENAAGMVKYHVDEIKKHFNKLVDLVGDDKEIRSGVRDLFSDALMTFMTVWGNSAAKLGITPEELLDILKNPLPEAPRNLMLMKPDYPQEDCPKSAEETNCV